MYGRPSLPWVVRDVFVHFIACARGLTPTSPPALSMLSSRGHSGANAYYLQLVARADWTTVSGSAPVVDLRPSPLCPRGARAAGRILDSTLPAAARAPGEPILCRNSALFDRTSGFSHV